MRLGHPSTLDVDGRHRSTGVVAYTHVVATTTEAGKQGGVQHTAGDSPFSNRHMGAVPLRALAPYLYFGPAQRRRRMHDGSADVSTDVEHDGPFFAGTEEMVVLHDYDGTETGVTDGFR